MTSQLELFAKEKDSFWCTQEQLSLKSDLHYSLQSVQSKRRDLFSHADFLFWSEIWKKFEVVANYSQCEKVQKMGKHWFSESNNDIINKFQLFARKIKQDFQIESKGSKSQELIKL